MGLYEAQKIAKMALWFSLWLMAMRDLLSLHHEQHLIRVWICEVWVCTFRDLWFILRDCTTFGSTWRCVVHKRCLTTLCKGYHIYSSLCIKLLADGYFNQCFFFFSFSVEFSFFSFLLYLCMLSCTATEDMNFWRLACRESRDRNCLAVIM